MDGRIARVMKTTVASAVGPLVDGTPADTGKARSNWVGTLDIESTAILEPFAPGRHLGKGESGNAAIAKSSILNTIRAFNIKTNSFINISNNAPYIRKLNSGSVTLRPENQPAENFVGKAILTVLNTAKQQRLFVRRS